MVNRNMELTSITGHKRPKELQALKQLKMSEAFRGLKYTKATECTESYKKLMRVSRGGGGSPFLILTSLAFLKTFRLW